jgi:hypothetical protein
VWLIATVGSNPTLSAISDLKIVIRPSQVCGGRQP